MVLCFVKRLSLIFFTTFFDLEPRKAFVDFLLCFCFFHKNDLDPNLKLLRVLNMLLLIMAL
jgi:hypothetical protein